MKSSAMKFFGIFGNPLQHTLSPVFQEAGFRKIGKTYKYLVFEMNLENFKAAMKQLKKTPGLQGFNLTVPYKREVMPYLDRIDSEAKAIGAVNTVYKRQGRWFGANTDAEGFTLSLSKELGFNPKRKQAVIIGAGGASRAVLYALAKKGAKKITVFNRSLENAEKVTGEFKELFPGTQFECRALSELNFQSQLIEPHLIVNTTSVGLRKEDQSLISKDVIPKANAKTKKVFVDLIYSPAQTDFLKAAKAQGHDTLNGLSMLMYQGVLAFEFWTNEKAPTTVMRSALEGALKVREAAK